MWELDFEERWVPKNWCFWTVVLEKTLESSLDCEEINVYPKVNQYWIFTGTTDAEAKAEAPILWLPDVKNWLIWKSPDAGKDWRQEEKGTTEDGSLMASPPQCCCPWSAKSQTWLNNWVELNWIQGIYYCKSGSSAGKESNCNAEDSVSIPGLARSPAEESGYSLQYSCLKNSMDRGAWQATVHGVAKIRHNWATHFHTYPETILRSYY